MKFEDILAVSGKPGLFKIVVKTRTGAVVESLLDNKRLSVGAKNDISALSEMAIYTLTNEVPLAKVLKRIKIKYNGKPTDISHKANKSDLEAFFFNILQDYDKDRVYASDIKKVIQWYNLLQKNNLLDLFDDTEPVEAKNKG